MKRSNTGVLFLSRAALIAALYAALTYATIAISSGVIQFRISEALCILPLFLPEAIPGLFIGCALANLFPAFSLPDMIFGSLATLIGAVGAYLLRRLPHKLRWLAPLPTILANALIVPLVLRYAYGAPDGYWFMFMTVGIGEVVCAGFGGATLYYLLSGLPIFKNSL
ncbi:MAG: QueT transporter family protein [Clostridia bacterium]|nr:QueT transporter family protein [Clostridia bacterium]